MTVHLSDRCKKIKMVLTDVDGVLTDCGMYYTSKGDVMKKFHTRDGMGVTLLKKKNIPTIIVTKEITEVVKQWAQKMKVEKLYEGVVRKEDILDKICKAYNVLPDEVAYIGDDVNDLELMKRVGFSIAPKDGILSVRKIADYVCVLKGGRGVLREVVDMILDAKFGRGQKIY